MTRPSTRSGGAHQRPLDNNPIETLPAIRASTPRKTPMPVAGIGVRAHILEQHDAARGIFSDIEIREFLTNPDTSGMDGLPQSMQAYGFHLRLGRIRYRLPAGSGDNKRKTV